MSTKRTRGSVATAATATFLATATLVGACKDDPAGGPTAVREVCEARKAWQQSTRRECTTCFAKAALPKCGSCTDKEYSGRCSEQDAAMRKEPTCEGVLACTLACKDDDCGCTDRCYEGKPACAKLGAAREACISQACDASCR